MEASRIRVFCIIARIDQGRTTLSHRLLHRNGMHFFPIDWIVQLAGYESST
jgi:translation elongation factor EF-G